MIDPKCPSCAHSPPPSSGKHPKRRAWGAGSVWWRDKTTVVLRVRIDGVRHTKTVRVARKEQGGRGEAQRALEEFQAGLEAAATNPRSEWTLGGLVEDYAASRQRIGKARSTVESYRHVAGRLTKEIAATPIDGLTPDDFDQFYGALAERGLAANTIRQTHAVLVAALNYAMKKDWVTQNAAARATPPDAKGEANSRLIPAQVLRLVELAGKPEEDGGQGDLVLAMAVFIAAYAGLRRGELCGLRWDDFDPDMGTLSVERQWVAGNGTQYLAPLKSATGTSNGIRTVHIGPDANGVIQRYRESQQLLFGKQPIGWLLSNDAGVTPSRAKALGMSITTLGEKLGMRISPQTFRRFHDTQLVAAGVDVDTVARRSGHTPEVMMRHYVQGADDRLEAASLRLEERLTDQGLPMEGLMELVRAT